MQINNVNSKDLALLQIMLNLASQNVGLAIDADRNDRPLDYESRLDNAMMFIASALQNIYSKPAIAALIAASYPKKEITSDLKPITNESLPVEKFDSYAHSIRPTMNYRRRKEVVPHKFLSAALRIGKL